ncbi:MAG: hypothetical protein AAB316_18570, partial [Bacteroidota bacterium]
MKVNFTPTLFFQKNKLGVALLLAGMLLMTWSFTPSEGQDSFIRKLFSQVKAGIAKDLINKGVLTEEQATTLNFMPPPPPAPGNIASGMQFWLHAGAGTSLDASNNFVSVSGTPVWADQSGNGRDIDFVNSNPAVVPGALSFNPVVDWDGDDFVRIDDVSKRHFFSTYTEGEVFTVMKATNLTNNSGMPYYLGGTSAAHYTYVNGYVYDDFGSASGHRKAWHPSTLAVAEGGGTTAGGAVDATQFHIYNNYSKSNDWAAAFDGQTAYSDFAHTPSFAQNGHVHIGARNGLVFNGQTAEHLFFNRKLTTDERQRVNSYLGAKYGITLKHDYFASDWNGVTGGKYWDVGGSGGYDSDIAGILRDDALQINQLQGRSASPGFQPAIGLGNLVASNDQNTNSFSADKTAMFWGSDGGETLFKTALTAPSGIALNYRMSRIWKIDETGTVGTVKFAAPKPLANGGAVYLVRSADATFDASDTYTQLTNLTVNGIEYLAADVDFADGSFFTLAAYVVTPGCVTNIITNDCNVVQNGEFSAAAAWTLGTGWSIGGTALNYHDAATNFDLSQTAVGLNNGPVANQVTLSFDVYTNGSGNIATSSTTARLELLLDGTKYLDVFNPSGGTTAAVSVFNGATCPTTSVAIQGPWTNLVVTIPWVSKPNSASLAFRFSANGDDFQVDNVFAAGGTCPGDLKLWLKADAVSGVADNANASIWENQSPNYESYDVPQATASLQPKFYSTTAANLVNFNPAFSFDGGDEFRNTTRLFSNTSPWTIIALGVDRRTNAAELRAPVGIGDGNFPALDWQTDGASPNGWNPWSSVDGEWNGGSAVLYDLGKGANNLGGNIVGLSSNNVVSGSDNIISYVNGLKQATTLSSNQNASFGNGIYVGSSGGEQWKGLIPEIIVYDRQLSDAEMQRTYSYLALKYGVTLRQDYLSATGAVLFNADGSGATHTFDNGIAGIGRDNCTGLHQKQSKSMATGEFLTIANTDVATSNLANPWSMTDQTFEIWGHNGGAKTYTSTYSPVTFTPVATYVRMARIWKVEETGTVGVVKISIPEQIAAENLIVSPNADLSGGTEIALVNDGAGNLTCTVNFTDGQYFSFGRNQYAPGCVATNLQHWLKADFAVERDTSSFVTAWNDQSAYDRATDFVQSDPLWQSTGLNYNPTVDFDGNDYLRIDNAATKTFPSTFTQGEVFAVTKAENTSGSANGNPYDYGGNSTPHYFYATHIYNDFGANVRKAWTPGNPTTAHEGGGTVSGSPVDVTQWNVFHTYSAANDWKSGLNGK